MREFRAPIDTQDVLVLNQGSPEFLSWYLIDRLIDRPGATPWMRRNPPADGRGILIKFCKRCLDSSVNDLSTLHHGGGKGIRTPDLLHAMQTRYQLRHTPVRIAT